MNNQTNLSRLVFKTFLTLSVIFLLTGCKKEERTPFNLSLTANKMEAPLNSYSFLAIVSGNGDYSIDVEDEDIAEATYSQYSGLTFGAIGVQGKKKGETTVSITDNKTGQVAKLAVKVVDFYLPLVVSTSNHPALEQYMRIFLVDNDDKDVYFFSVQDNQLNLRQKGTYDFQIEVNDDVVTPYLLLTYSSDEKGEFTDAAIAPTVHKFDLTGSDGAFYQAVNAAFGMEWELTPSIQPFESPISFIYANMKEIGTDNDVRIYIGGSSGEDYMPEGHL